MIKVSDWEVQQALFEAVHERGYGFVYKADERGDGTLVPECVNVDRGDDGELKPGCIVGTTLYKLGVPLETLSMFEGGSYSTLDKLKSNDILTVSSASAVALNAIQAAQDGGATWGECLQFFNYVRNAYEGVRYYDV